MLWCNVRGMYEPMHAMQTRHEPVYLIRACFRDNNNAVFLNELLRSYSISQCSLRYRVRQAIHIQYEQLELPTI